MSIRRLVPLFGVLVLLAPLAAEEVVQVQSGAVTINGSLTIGSGQTVTGVDNNPALGTAADQVPTQQAVKTYVDGAVPQVLDEDDFASDSATAAPSQQSVRVYADGAYLNAGANLSDLGDPATARVNLGLPTVSQGEAEAGTGTAVRAWTPQRVRQAVEALAPSGGSGGSKVAVTGDLTLHVATTGSDTTGDGSISAPWATIQHALDRIHVDYYMSSSRVSAITLQLADGTYALDDAINITQPIHASVYLTGNTTTPGNVRIQTSASWSGASELIRINNKAALGGIAGVTFGTGSSTTVVGLLMDGGQMEVLNDVTFEGTAFTLAALYVIEGSHLRAKSGGNIVISGVQQYDLGIFASASTLDIDGIAISGGSGSNGIRAIEGSFANLTNGSFIRDPVGGSNITGDGLEFAGGSKALVENFTITFNGDGLGNGVVCTDSSDVSLLNCTISDLYQVYYANTMSRIMAQSVTKSNYVDLSWPDSVQTNAGAGPLYGAGGSFIYDF